METVDGFLTDLASAEPVPGGGSVAALETAMGAALLAMVANLTIGKKKYADVQDQALSIRDRAEELRRRARQLVDEDVRAYGGVGDVMRMPRDTDEQKTARREAMQSALKVAAEPPLEIMRVAADVMDLANALVRIGNRAAISDVGVAALSVRAGFHAARLNVEINLAGVRDEAWVGRVRDRMRAIPTPDSAEAEVMDVTEGAIFGTGA